MDRATLAHAKSTISRCIQNWTPSIITRQQALVDIESTLLHRPTAVGYYYVHGQASNSDTLFKQVCNKYKTNRTDGAWALIYSIIGVLGASNRGPQSTALLILLNGVQWRDFLKSTVAHANMAYVSPITPLLGMIRHSFGILDIVSMCAKLTTLSFNYS